MQPRPVTQDLGTVCGAQSLNGDKPLWLMTDIPVRKFITITCGHKVIQLKMSTLQVIKYDMINDN
jgi:hypothetical protein